VVLWKFIASDESLRRILPLQLNFVVLAFNPTAFRAGREQPRPAAPENLSKAPASLYNLLKYIVNILI
jgi:hypothetical protein